MSAKDIILEELEGVPEPLLDEVIDFLRFLKEQHRLERVEPALLSQRALAKDWLRPEEEAAWRGL